MGTLTRARATGTSFTETDTRGCHHAGMTVTDVFGRVALGSGAPVELIPEGFISVAAFDGLGLTYRQIDYWTRVGYLRTHPDAARGSGYKRLWYDGEQQIAVAMSRLMHAGLPISMAARVARECSRDAPVALRLEQGVIVTVTPALWALPDTTDGGE